MVKSIAPKEAVTLAAKKLHSRFHTVFCSGSFISKGYSRGDRNRIPPVAAKLSCKLILLMEYGFQSSNSKSAALKLVSGSGSRQKMGAANKKIIITQARTTEGVIPTIII